MIGFVATIVFHVITSTVFSLLISPRYHFFTMKKSFLYSANFKKSILINRLSYFEFIFDEKKLLAIQTS